jgi:hypothetical protein
VSLTRPTNISKRTCASPDLQQRYVRHHVEEMDFGHGVLGVLYDAVTWRWFERSVETEVAEISRLLQSHESGRECVPTSRSPATKRPTKRV